VGRAGPPLRLQRPQVLDAQRSRSRARRRGRRPLQGCRADEGDRENDGEQAGPRPEGVDERTWEAERRTRGNQGAERPPRHRSRRACGRPGCASGRGFLREPQDRRGGGSFRKAEVLHEGEQVRLRGRSLTPPADYGAGLFQRLDLLRRLLQQVPQDLLSVLAEDRRGRGDFARGDAELHGEVGHLVPACDWVFDLDEAVPRLEVGVLEALVGLVDGGGWDAEADEPIESLLPGHGTELLLHHVEGDCLDA